MTSKARNIAAGGGLDTSAFLTSSDLTGYLTDQSTLDPSKLDNTGTIPSELLDDVGGENTPAFSVKISSNQNVTSGTTTTVPFNSEDLDTDDAFDPSNHRFTPQTSGKYFITFTLYALTASAGNGNLRAITGQIVKNGNDLQSQVVQDYNDSFTRQGCVTTSAVVELNGTTDYVEFSCDITANSGDGKLEHHTRASGFKLA